MCDRPRLRGHVKRLSASVAIPCDTSMWYEESNSLGFFLLIDKVEVVPEDDGYQGRTQGVKHPKLGY